MRIGIHRSIAGSLERAALSAAEVGANTLQIFSSSPRQWKASIPTQPAIRLLDKAREKHGLTPLVIHDNYLINLAASDDRIRAKSIDAFRGEIERALAIGAEYLVAHPGNYKGLSIEQGILRFLEGVAAAADGLHTKGLTLLLENTAGAGAQLGGRLEELSVMKEYGAKMTDLAIGFCLDTCHLLTAGYDVSTEEGLKKTLAEADRLLGLPNVSVIHANDSKAPCGSHIDRHENIGKGFIGEAGFARILRHPKLKSKAFLLETPVETDDDARRDIEMLKKLARL